MCLVTHQPRRMKTVHIITWGRTTGSLHLVPLLSLHIFAIINYIVSISIFSEFSGSLKIIELENGLEEPLNFTILYYMEGEKKFSYHCNSK